MKNIKFVVDLNFVLKENLTVYEIVRNEFDNFEEAITCYNSIKLNENEVKTFMAFVNGNLVHYASKY